MHKLMKATGAGLKHFFGARESISQQKNLGRQLSAAGTKVKKSKILAVMGMYAIYKGSPIGLAKNISDSIKVGRWKHSDLKQQQRDVDTFLANAGMSAQGAEAVSRLIRNGAFDGEMYTQLSPQDAAILDGLENDLRIEAGHCINF
ncbi:MAG: hypothetical protein ACYDCY_04005 [Metallibacterium sp.]